nr:MAG TPA: deoxynucleoside monophosphate kinase [Caudoviricetes sp.]
MPRSGKDTFVSFASKYATTTNFSSVDFVKDVARFAGWNGEKDPKSRLFLSELKELLTEYDDIPYKKIAEEIHWFKNQPEQELLFIHIREPGEIARIVRDFGAITILVKRANNQQIVSNDSDKYTESYNYDFVLNNDSDLDALDAKARGFVNYLKRS